MILRALVALLLISLALPVSDDASGQPTNTDSSARATPVTLKGRHDLSIGVGLLPDAQANPGNLSTNGFLASFSYTYWPYPEWGLAASASLFDSELAGGNAASISSILFGVRYYPEALALGSVARPYLSGAIGPYIGSETGNGFREAGPQVQTVVGARLGAGIDIYALNWLRLGLHTAYHLAPEYEDAVGTIESASGTQLSLEMGLSFGGV
jgi:hypothetical protein